jgi:hypothetical protein
MNMKSTIKLSAITVLAAVALAGCGQKTTDNSTGAASTNSGANVDSGATTSITNAPATGSVPDVNTNSPAINSVPDMNTNAPAGTNQ